MKITLLFLGISFFCFGVFQLISPRRFADFSRRLNEDWNYGLSEESFYFKVGFVRFCGILVVCFSAFFVSVIIVNWAEFP